MLSLAGGLKEGAQGHDLVEMERLLVVAAVAAEVASRGI